MTNTLVLEELGYVVTFILDNQEEKKYYIDTFDHTKADYIASIMAQVIDCYEEGYVENWWIEATNYEDKKEAIVIESEY